MLPKRFASYLQIAGDIVSKMPSKRNHARRFLERAPDKSRAFFGAPMAKFAGNAHDLQCARKKFKNALNVQKMHVSGTSKQLGMRPGAEVGHLH